ncbi:hypothetical protein BGX30_006203 [Mortierella sp. GBA39]|nr:hypothetical protein BGX30_006203 [Mortierella sp. GBA39]
MTRKRLSLWCLVNGDPISKAFELATPSAETFGQLRSTIHLSKPIWFKDLEVEDLTLWHVSIPIVLANKHRPILLNEFLESATEVDPTDDVSVVFPKTPPKKTIHIIVQRPPPAHAVWSMITPNAKLYVIDAYSGNLRVDITRITDEFFAPGSDVTKFLDNFVRGVVNLPLTTGSVPGLPRVWLRNKGQLANTYPSLLFSSLPDPSLSGTQSQYPTSDAILQLIERCQTSTVPIFGVSGCGKTRGMIELLSRRWGFYFNAAGDDLGSGDITILISVIGTRLQSDREANNHQARTITYLLMLSRLKIFQHCLTISGSYQTFTSARWTILQTCPHVLHNDIFAQLFESFLPILAQYQTPSTESNLVAAVQGEFQATRHLLEEHGRQGGLPSFSDSDRLLVVHDEAQILGDKWDGRFSSLSTGEPDRPLLSPVLWGFRNISETKLTLMTSGTGISIYTQDWARGSGPFNKSTRSLSGENGFEYMEFPGWTGRESIEAYVAGLRYLLPTEDAKQALGRLLPSEAIDEMMERLVGRFRPIVTVIEKIIARGEPDGWQDAMDDTEARLVSYDHCGEQGNLCHEIVRLECKYLANLSIFKELRTVGEVLGLLLFQRYIFGADRLVLQGAVPELVERAFGRIKIIDGVARTVLDEPFVLKAAENFFKMRDSDFMKTIEWWVQQSDRAQAHGYAWELMMMNVLTEVFKTRAFSDWPHELLILSQCAKLAGTAVIVGLDEQGLQRGISHEHISMEEFMDAHVNTNSLRQGQPVPPFFFPKANPSGPDIVFYIRVKDRLFPVFVQLKLRQIVTKKEAKAALKTVSAPTIETHVRDLGRFCPTDNTYISMIIAYPATVSAKLFPRPDFAYDLRPRPGRKHECLTQIKVIIDKSNISKIFPQSHVDFLDGIKAPLKRPAVDTEETEDLKKTKKD